MQKNAIFVVELALNNDLKPKTLKVSKELSGRCPQLRKFAPSTPEQKFRTYRDEKVYSSRPLVTRDKVAKFVASSTPETRD
jgi:hypothetical protein